MKAISLKHACFAYPSGAEMHFNFDVKPSERLAILGASGSGKSTLLHLLAGFETLQSGAVFFENADFSLAEPAKRPISILFQDNNLFGHLTIAQNIGLGLIPRLQLSKSQKDAVNLALAKVGLTGLGNRLPSELSGGERQRAALARCLLRDKPVLLLDEPFAALGPAMRVEMLDLVLALQAEKNLTVIMVTHSADDAAHFATQIGFIEAGALNATLPVSVLKYPPKGSALEAYLGSRHNNS